MGFEYLYRHNLAGERWRTLEHDDLVVRCATSELNPAGFGIGGGCTVRITMTIVARSYRTGNERARNRRGGQRFDRRREPGSKFDISAVGMRGTLMIV